ncbi:MAG: hypothetical protein RMZ41_029920 [Nostoc sp. DedVER02]|uniref:hypothetical protein n=1 Tax=Nostoc sp. DedVER02 TaxID=3075405 RepID=UPI00391B0A03
MTKRCFYEFCYRSARSPLLPWGGLHKHRWGLHKLRLAIALGLKAPRRCQQETGG